MLLITFLFLFGLALVLAFAKSTTEGRPRGRFAPASAWDVVPARPARVPVPASEVLHCDLPTRSRA